MTSPHRQGCPVMYVPSVLLRCTCDDSPQVKPRLSLLVGALTSETATALPEGIDRREAARIGLACEKARRAVAELQARVEAGVVG